MTHFGTTRARDSYFMDLENGLVQGSWMRPIPKGVGRADYHDWTDLIRKNLDVCKKYGRTMKQFAKITEARLAEHMASGDTGICVLYSDETERDELLEEYLAWVRAGGGDEWFDE